MESELVDLSAEERQDFLQELGVAAGETGLEKLIREAYELLQLRTYFTSGETETKAWTIRKGMLAPQAAGVIHTDFEKGFIRAETVAYADLGRTPLNMLPKFANARAYFADLATPGRPLILNFGSCS